MTLSTTTNRVTYDVSGSTGPFTVPFRFLDDDDLSVIKRQSNVDTVLTKTTHYTVTGAGNATGSITLVSGFTGQLIIRRRPAITQPTSVRNQGAYYGATHEDAFDRMVMVQQAIDDMARRGFRLPEGLDPSGYSLMVRPETGKALVWQSPTELGNSSIVSDAAVTLPGGGRTVASLSAYLLNNAVWNLKDFGAVGDGTTDDTTAINAWLAAIPDAGVGYIPEGWFKFTSTLNIDKSITIIGAGNRAALKPVVGAGNDGIVVNSHATNNMYRVKMENFAILSNDACRYGITFNRVHVSEFNLHVRVPAQQYVTKINGCLISQFRIVTSVNFTYPYAAGIGTVGSVLITRDAANGIAANANVFDFVIEGGAKGVRIENQSIEGNSMLTGTIEGCTGEGLYIENCTGFSARDLHIEANAGGHTFKDCTTLVLDAVFTDGTLTFQNCRVGRLENIICNTISFDASCDRMQIGALKYGVAAGTFTDSSQNNIWLGPVLSAATELTAALNGTAGADFCNLFANGTLERWPIGGGGRPAGISFYGAEPTWARTGIGQVDTRRHTSRFALKATCSGANRVAIPFNANWVDGEWVTVWFWVFVPTGQPSITVQLWYDGGGSTLGLASIGADNAWKFYSAQVKCDSAFSTFEIVLTPSAAGDFYLADIGYTLGNMPVSRRMLPHARTFADSDLYIGSSAESGMGRLHETRSSMPAVGTYERGDVVWNRSPAVAGGAGSQYVITGWSRLTSGSGHVLNTDWAEMRVLTGT